MSIKNAKAVVQTSVLMNTFNGIENNFKNFSIIYYSGCNCEELL